jgi:hypothetical protein
MIETQISAKLKEEIYRNQGGICHICHRKLDPYYFDLTYGETDGSDMNVNTVAFAIHPECKDRKTRFMMTHLGILIPVIGGIFIVSGIISLISSVLTQAYNLVYDAFIYSMVGMMIIRIGAGMRRTYRRRNLSALRDRLKYVRVRNRFEGYY